MNSYISKKLEPNALSLQRLTNSEEKKLAQNAQITTNLAL